MYFISYQSFGPDLPATGGAEFDFANALLTIALDLVLALATSVGSCWV